MLQKNYFLIAAFFGHFLGIKQPKLTTNEENWQNPNFSMRFSEICYVDTLQQNKMRQKIYFFGFRPFLAVFNQKTIFFLGFQRFLAVF